MESTWESRDLPVLDAVIRLMERGGFAQQPTVRELALETGLDKMAVAKALEAMDGVYVDFQRFMSGGDPSNWRVKAVAPEARVLVGQWPTPDGLVDRLIEGLERAADGEPDAERKGKIRQVSNALGGAVRDVAVEVVAATITRGAGF